MANDPRPAEAGRDMAVSGVPTWLADNRSNDLLLFPDGNVVDLLPPFADTRGREGK